ncbi:6218_t:CDS:2 [Ambispora gerdemannii]|uniref:6218_t:CDS:1 n=1 Tax=Ambispora gerdemannii TaxID=144530 RepID=A0A9N8UZ38_9GLOM|nr:6218_t:CDS:2 [Ambispora gerdemannii]
MSCDLSDTAISQAYEEIVSGQDTNWLILGYHDTRDKISLYSKGTGGLDELRQNLQEEVLYGFLRIENRFVLITYVSEQVSGVRRARALVHGRAVGALFKQAHQIQINASTPADLLEEKVRSKLKLSASDDRPSSPSPQRQQNLRQGTLPGSPKSPIANDPDQDLAPYNVNGSENARREAEKAAREDAEREKIEAAQKRDAEKIAQELAKKRAFEESERKKQEAIDNQKKEKALAEARVRLEAEKKAREEAEKKRNEELRSKFAELEKSGKVLLDGYITVQGGGVYFWKRRYFELRGQTLYLFRDSDDKLPISKLELDSDVSGVSDAQSEVLILNSFKVDFRSTEPYYFFSDDRKTKESFVQAIARYVK